MFIFDAHAHVYPDKIAQKASEAIGGFYNIKMRYDGSIGTLLAAGAAAGIGAHLIHSVATVPEQAAVINDFIAQTAESAPGRLVGFATLHPEMKNAENEVSRVIKLGLSGVKLHHDFQKYNIDAPECFKLYAAIEGRLPLLIHTGDSRGGYSAPDRVLPVLERFPKLDVICAHFGGYTEWDAAVKYLAGRRVWVDTSSSLSFLGKRRALELIRAFGADRVLFGTDYPMWDVAHELMMIRSLGLSETQLEKILHGNIRALIGSYTRFQ